MGNKQPETKSSGRKQVVSEGTEGTAEKKKGLRGQGNRNTNKSPPMLGHRTAGVKKTIDHITVG